MNRGWKPQRGNGSRYHEYRLRVAAGYLFMVSGQLRQYLTNVMNTRTIPEPPNGGTDAKA